MREVIGPAPQQFGIISRVHAKPRNDNILQRNKKLNEQCESIMKDQKLAFDEKIKMNFFDLSDKKSKMQQIQRSVDEIMNQRSFLLFERRKKLKELLTDEQRQYEHEYLSLTVSPLERAAQLREKAKRIKTIKEQEDAVFVQEKLDQKWRSECDELRTFKSKQLQSGMRGEHLKQMEEKICRERHRLEEEAIFATLWQQDIQSKKDREDQEAAKVAARNREVSLVLQEQMQVLEKQKEEEKRIRAENARLMHEKKNIEKLEKQMMFEKKREQQANRRHELDICVRAKLINEARLAREEMSYDLKALEDSLISFQNEDEDKAKRKVELMEESRIYREYLRAQYEEEKRREKELDRIITEEIEKQFQKRLAQWKAERLARSKLLEKVLQERQLQINDKILRNQQRELELEQEKLDTAKLMEFYREQEKQEKESLKLKNKRYESDLLQQMEYTSQQNRLFNTESDLELNSYKQAELQYQNRLNDAMSSVQTLNLQNQANVVSGFCSKCRKDLHIDMKTARTVGRGCDCV